MSLDVSLIAKVSKPVRKTGIFIRENGRTKELTKKEAISKFPQANIREVCYKSDEVFRWNITHNLNKMAKDAGIYECCWRPDEVGIKKAKEMIPLLEKGLQELKSKPEYFKQFNPENGWGKYEGLVEFVENYLKACRDYPDADIKVSR